MSITLCSAIVPKNNILDTQKVVQAPKLTIQLCQTSECAAKLIVVTQQRWATFQVKSKWNVGHYNNILKDVLRGIQLTSWPDFAEFSEWRDSISPSIIAASRHSCRSLKPLTCSGYWPNISVFSNFLPSYKKLNR